ncbi:fasciclin domain-containing protein [Hymenobacter sp. GOD-10R]|uniref:fasciclin domain-containing protein n=1 Tax=Hymenobacter sp. GOD-10R TaxID=3093922 RepID=UPI002D79E4F5|nr:fasciclin domain-containing protein [Hymenobacter sp. GOD-10R]WRQ26454.1 fasciclin domain-containing protein [Hymenobacter sp. GOD-10R]
MKKTFRTTSYFLLSASILATSLASCGGDNKGADVATQEPGSTMSVADSANMPTDSARMGKADGVMVDGVAMTPDRSIVQNAVQAKSMTTLVKAVQAAGLDGTLSGAGPYTVFAPNNAAFDKLPKGALAGLMRPESKDKLKGLLTYHVIASRLLAADLRDGQELTTVNGEKIKVSVKDGKVMINNATVSTPDVVSSNGVTHIIDTVLMPPAETE